MPPSLNNATPTVRMFNVTAVHNKNEALLPLLHVFNVTAVYNKNEALLLLLNSPTQQHQGLWYRVLLLTRKPLYTCRSISGRQTHHDTSLMEARLETKQKSKSSTCRTKRHEANYMAIEHRRIRLAARNLGSRGYQQESVGIGMQSSTTRQFDT